MTTIDQLREDLAEARATSALNAEALAVCQRGVQALRLELEAQREKYAIDMAAAQARVAEMRTALQDVVAFNTQLKSSVVYAGQPQERWARIQAALSAPDGISALRAFGLKVAKATDEATIDDHNCFEDFEAIVDAALAGVQ